MDAGARSWWRRPSPSAPLCHKVPLHTTNPFREERTRSVNQTRTVLHVHQHCSSSSSPRSVKLSEQLSNSFCATSKHHSSYLLDIIVPPIFIVGHVDAIRRINCRSWSYFHHFCSLFDLDLSRRNVYMAVAIP